MNRKIGKEEIHLLSDFEQEKEIKVKRSSWIMEGLYVKWDGEKWTTPNGEVPFAVDMARYRGYTDWEPYNEEAHKLDHDIPETQHSRDFNKGNEDAKGKDVLKVGDFVESKFGKKAQIIDMGKQYFILENDDDIFIVHFDKMDWKKYLP